MRTLAVFMFALLAWVSPSLAQTLTITNSKPITDVSGAVFTGKLGFTPVSGPGGPTISAYMGGGGQIVPYARYFNVTNGQLQSGATLADTATTSPVNLCYRVTYRYAGLPTNEADNGVLASCYQPSSAVAGSTDFASVVNYINPALPVVQTGPRGAPGQVALGTVTALPYGSAPTVTNTGDNIQSILNFGIPGGAPGSTLGMLDATAATGSELGAKVNAALASCTDSAPCHVFVPAGSYTQSTSIHLPNRTQGLEFTCDHGAYINYTGSGSFLDTTPAVNGQFNRGGTLIDGGCVVNGNANAISGVHIRAGAGYAVIGLSFQGFPAGDGIWIDGANHVLLWNNNSTNNLDGLHLTGNWCNGANACQWDRTAPGTWASTSVSAGTGYAPNAIHAIGNRFTQNSRWGVIEGDVMGGSVSPPYDNLYEGNTIEQNGVGAFATGQTVNTTIRSTYFEANTRGIVEGCVPGEPGITIPTGYSAQFCGTATGVHVQDNFFNDPGTNEVYLAHVGGSTIADNTKIGAATCLVDSGVYTGDISLHGNVLTIGAGSETCGGGIAGGDLLNYREYNDTATHAKHFFSVDIDNTLQVQQLIRSDIAHNTIDASQHIVGSMGAVTFYQSSVAPLGSCGAPNAVEVLFSPSGAYICAGQSTWQHLAIGP